MQLHRRILRPQLHTDRSLRRVAVSQQWIMYQVPLATMNRIKYNCSWFVSWRDGSGCDGFVSQPVDSKWIG